LQYNNIIPGSFVPYFDTTLADTDNMIDLSADATSIYIRTAGVYSFFWELDISVPLTGTDVSIQPTIRDAVGTQIAGNYSVQTLSLTTSPNMPLRTDGTRLANYASTAEIIANCGVGYTLSFQITVGGATNIVSFIQTFRAGAMWLRGPL
jgi:hypothetical protein